ncbi:hypothetical protein HPB51_001538 [Rhipicephalus microplus]|uniref:CCHC-type domain-containing protein n=1 Tax=Rhipicephalus microplus TaxID=6941 RepID=A0A9J6EQU8_RHIMP|nr:hypothetical protein HPB51_001538 [Rhipicephalus microplus]
MAAALAHQDLMEDSICPNVTQNIFVVCTPIERNARAYTTVQQLRLRDTLYRVAVYPAPPDNTCKGVIRGIDIDLTDTQLRELIVTKRNPSALEVKRIKNTTAVTILFQGMQVPNYVYCGASIVRCTLFRRHTEVCYNCGSLGHRADVCPNPNTTWCRKFRTSYANDDADAVDAVVAAPEDRVEPAPAIPAPPRAPMRHPGEAAPSHRQRDVAVPSAATPAPGDTPHLARLS